MTPVILLDVFREFAKHTLKDLILPVKPHKENQHPDPRAPEVHLMNLPDRNAETQKAPYILLQMLTGVDDQKEGEYPESFCNIRVVTCIYCEDAEEGALNVLNVLMRLRIALLKQRVVGQQFTLRLPLEYLVYPDNTAPYFMGEMMTVWEFQTIQREVDGLWQKTITPSLDSSQGSPSFYSP